MKKFLAATMLLWSSIALCAQPAPILRTQFTTNASTAGNSKLVRTTATGAPAPVTIGTGISFDGTTLSGTGTNLPSLYVNGANVAGANLTNGASLNVSVTSSNISFTPTNLTTAQFANSIITNLGLLSWTNIWSGTNTFNVIPIVPNNSFALGTKTTGNFVSDVAGTAAEVTVTHTPSEGSTATISLPIAMTLTGKVLTGGTYSNSTLVTPAIGVATGTSVALGADPADAGVIRLENGALIAWEASPASTDLTLTVNSSELFVFSADVTVPDLAYNAGTWDGSLAVPTRNAMRDKIEAMSAASGVPIQVNGTNLTVLQVTNSATVTWSLGAGSNLTATVSAGSGDITSVGDVASGAAFDGTQGTTLTFNDAGGDHTLLFNTTLDQFEFSTNVVGAHFTSTNGFSSLGAGTGSLILGNTGVTLVDDGDGALVITGAGTGSDEDLNLNLDDTANNWVFTSSTGVTNAMFLNIGIEALSFIGPLIGTATIASTATVSAGSDSTSFPTFVDTLTGNHALRTHAAYQFDASSLTLAVSTLTATNLTFLGTGTLTDLDAIAGTTEATLEAALDIGGDVVGTGLSAVVIADNAVDGTDIALGSDTTGDVMYYNGTDWIRLGVGANGTVLKLAGGVPTWGTDDTAGAPVWNTIGDAAADGSVAFGQTTQDITGNTDDVTAIAQDVFRITLTNDGATDVLTQRVLVVRNASAAGGTTEVLLDLENNDNSTVTTGLSIEGTSTGAITTGIDASDAEIVTALAIGANTITTAAATIASTELDLLDGKTSPLLSQDEAQTLTNKTFDASAPGNILKFLDYKDFVYPAKVDGANCTIITNDVTSALWGLATFNGTGETNTSWSFFRLGVVPPDLDTAVELTIKNLAVRVSGTDADAATLDFGLFSPASSAGHAPTAWSSFSTFIRASVTPSSPAAEDIFYFADITLTGWAAGVTAGRPFIIGIARLNTTNDDSITIVSGDVEYGRTK